MGQYRTGTASVTNASATVTVTGASVGADNVAAGDAFKVDRDNETVYSISARTPASGPSITSLTISPVYGGTTGSGLGYQITQDFTPNRSYPEFAQGDQDAADWLTKALRMIDTDMGLLLGSGGALSITNNQIVFWNAGLKGSANLTWNGTSFAVATAGPHGFGPGINNRTQLIIHGTYTPTGTLEGGALSIESTINVPANQDGYILSLGGTANPTLNKASSGTHGDFAFLRIVGPLIGAGAAALTNSSSLKIVGPPTGAIGTNNYALWVADGSVRWTQSGPHAIGGALSGVAALVQTGTFANPSGDTYGYQCIPTLSPGPNGYGLGLNILPVINEAGSGTHPDFASLYVQPPVINGAAAALTNASTVKITGAPAGATNNRALWVIGTVEFNGLTSIISPDTNAAELDLKNTSAGGHSWSFISAGSAWGGGGLAGRLLFYDGTSGGDRFGISSGGVVGIGTVITTGVNAGEIVEANAKAYRFLSAGGSGANYGISSDANDDLNLMVPAAGDLVFVSFAGTARFFIANENSGGGFRIGEASADWAAPAANNVNVYAKDNGSGKTQLVARFNTGAVQIMATEP